MSNLDQALTYAAWGWHVLPVVRNGKTPATANGVHDATTDPNRIRQWWAKNPNYNIGIATGHKSGIMVFDIDPRNGGNDTWFDWMEQQGHECLTDAPMQLTAGGGMHYVAQYNDQLRSCKMLDGVDLLSDGRYFIAYPSEVNGGFYDWEADSDPGDGKAPFQVPANWVTEINGGKTSNEVIRGGGDVITGARNTSLTALAGSLRNIGLSETEMLAALIQTNNDRCVPPLPASEVRQIANSVARYEPDGDVLADTSIGEQFARAMLGGQASSDFHFTSARYLIDQPSPVPFIVSKWLPANAVGTIFGKPGVGKTFIAMSLAFAIATGREWFGHQVKQPGAVLYMAGEGNWGIRQRIAALCQAHECYDIDNLYVSNKGVDLDLEGAQNKVLQAVNEIGVDSVSVIFIDTLNRHMTGDENKATDMRKFLDVCSMIAAATNATVILIHHSGHGEGAGNRERGSSALRGAMDFSLLAYEDTGQIALKCVKMKDSKHPDKLYGSIQEGSLNWADEDGEISNGAYFSAQENCAEPQGEDPKLREFWRVFIDAWANSGAELSNGAPYLTTSALREYLQQLGRDGDQRFQSASNVKNHSVSSQNNKTIGYLVELGHIEKIDSGYRVFSYPEVYDHWEAKAINPKTSGI